MNKENLGKEEKVPKSIGIIMDGNRRWAKGKGLPAMAGHLAGYKKVKEVVKWVENSQVKYLTLYTFSIENWKRETKEVNYLMKIIFSLYKKEIKNFLKNNIRVKVIGDKTLLSPETFTALEKIEKETGDCTGLTLVLAISYGGRQEIIGAIKKLSQEKTKEEIVKITEKDFENYLWTKGNLDPDLIIRTSGEMRLSNFLPWQSAYSELFFTKTFWPDFSEKEFKNILEEFTKRQRRYGK